MFFCSVGYFAISKGHYVEPNGAYVSIDYSFSSFLFWGLIGIGIGIAAIPLPAVLLELVQYLIPRKRIVQQAEQPQPAQSARPSFSYSDWEDVKDYRNSDFEYRRPNNDRYEAPRYRQPDVKPTPYGVDKRDPRDAAIWAIVDDPNANPNERENACLLYTSDAADE